MRGHNINLEDYADSTILGLVEQVQKYKILYYIPRQDRSAIAVIKRRNEKWSEIGSLLGLPAMECFSIWNKLRSTFTRIFKYYQKSKGSTTVSNPNRWKFFESLLFLIPYIEYAGQQSTGVLPSPAPQSHSTVSSIAKKALKRSKNILMKNKENGGDPNSLDLTFQPGGARLKINVIHLVELVKQHPVIFNKGTLQNSDAKKAAWQEIAHEIGSSPRACLTRWMYLWRKLQLVARRGHKDKWIWSSVMEYFVPFLTRRPRSVRRHEHTMATQSINMAEQDYEGVGDDDSSFISDNGASQENHNSIMEPYTMLKMEPAHVDGELHIVQASPDHHADGRDEESSGVSYWRPTVKESPQYSEYNFGICTAEMLEDIPKENRAKLKAKILQVLSGAI